jgi:hypothetical protein
LRELVDFAITLDKDLTISFQHQQMAELLRINAEQAKAIEFLKARVHELENNQKKNSSNSRKPHSSDMGKPKQTQSLRSSSGKKPGGSNRTYSRNTLF